MNRTKIEWVKNPDGSAGYTINPVKGYCPMPCTYCYSKAMYNRFGWPKEIRFDAMEMFKAASVKEPSRFFVGSMIELFGPWVDNRVMWAILHVVRRERPHRFIFLTKNPNYLVDYDWPDNAWVGASVTDMSSLKTATKWLGRVCARVKFISFEPLLDHITEAVDFTEHGIKWIIIGAQTQPYRPAPQFTVKWLCGQADRQGVPVFLKDNLNWPVVRREWPEPTILKLKGD